MEQERWIDISHILNEKTPVFPGDYKTSLTKIKSLEEDYYTGYLLKSGFHTGTHIDIPMHLIREDKTTAEYPVSCFAGKGVLLDVRGEQVITMKPQYEKMDLDGNVVLLYTGFDQYYFEDKYFTEHPVVGDELAEFLLSQKIKILGMDMPAPDYPPFTFHKELLIHEIFVLENLTNLKKLTEVTEFEVIAFPLKIEAEASFVRAVCRVAE